MSAGRGPRRAGEDRALELALLDDLYAHWARGEFFATQELYDPALEFVFSDDFPEAGVHQGIEGMGAAFVAWLRAWELWRVRADEYRVAPDGRIVVLATFHGRGKGSQADVVSLGANVWTFRDGRVVRLEIHAARCARAAQPERTGSSAWSLISVSASSAAGSESRTTPTPA